MRWHAPADLEEALLLGIPYVGSGVLASATAASWSPAPAAAMSAPGRR